MEHEQCEACGFEGGSYDDAALLAELRALGARWQTLLAGAGDNLRIRPEPQVWSAIEYAAHSRDITALHEYGVEQALSGDEPVFGEIDADALIDEAASSYPDADPDQVGAELATHASHLAQLAGAADKHAWTYGLTVAGSRSDVRRLLEHALHDSVHHLADVERGLAALRR